MSIRLTLRVLLAYVDGVLEPAEMAEVEPRIKESEAAQHLIERLKHSMVRADLTAPSPVDDDKYDANRIADYLDRVTPDSQIEELEKMFLASDALLAELASCHHILKLVLSGPPTFDPAIRERMRTLPAKADALLAERSKETNGEGKSKLKPAIGLPKSTAEIEQIAKSVLGEPPSGSIIAAAAASKGAAVVEPAEKPEIPDYLREPPNPVGKVLAVVALFGVLALVLVVMASMNPPKTAENTTATTPVVVATSEASPSGTPAVAEGTPETTPAATAIEPVAEGTAEMVGTATAPVAPAAPVGTAAAAPVAPAVPAGTGAPMGAAAVGAEVVKPAMPIAEPGSAAPGAPAAPGTGETTEPAGPAPETAPPVPSTKPTELPTLPAVPRVEVGQFTSPEEIILNFERSRPDLPADWRRLPPRAVLFSGDKLVSLPTFRPTLELTGGLIVDMVGAAIIEVLPPEDGVQNLRLVFGRIVIRGTKADAKLGLHVLDQKWGVTLGDTSSLLGVMVQPQITLGVDPGSTPPTTFASQFSLSAGKATIDRPDGQLVLENAPTSGTLLPLAETAYAAPNWLEGRNFVAPIDQRAGIFLQKELETDDPVLFRLSEIETDRRVEVRVLCLRSLGLLGEFKLLIQEIARPETRQQTREDILSHLRDVLAYDPLYPNRMKKVLDEMYGVEGPNLYRMLCGFTDQELMRGDAARLVGYLDDPDLLHRVMAFWNLKNITGVTFSYSPDVGSEKRKGPLHVWQQRLEQGAIRYKTPPAE